MYSPLAEEWDRAFVLRHDLIDVLSSQGLVRQAEKLARCAITWRSIVRCKPRLKQGYGCNARFCPVCLLRRRNRIFSAMRPRVESQMGDLGSASHLQLALPPGDGLVLERLDRVAQAVRSAKNSVRWRNRHRNAVGIVMGTEVGPGSAWTGHPHVHLFIYSHHSEELSSFLKWFCRRWEGVGAELIDGLDVIPLGRDPDRWAPALRYVLKGTELDPSWPPDLTREVVEAVSSKRRLFSTWGIADRPGGWTKALAKGPIPALFLKPWLVFSPAS